MKENTGESGEAGRIADQLQRAFYGAAWHGPAVMELLEDDNATMASARPIVNCMSRSGTEPR